MATVNMASKFSEIIKLLADKPTQIAKKSIFETNMHLMLFAAMVGAYKGELNKLNDADGANQIPDRIFKHNKYEGAAYLLALSQNDDVEILREEKDLECWKILEGYANTGLEEIDNWLTDNPADTEGTQTILNKIKEIAAKNNSINQDDSDGSEPEVI